MRWSSTALMFACVACGDAAVGGSEEQPKSADEACSIGSELKSAAIRALQSAAPRCTEHAECVVVQTRIEGAGAIIEDCGTVLHREAAARWDAPAVEALLSMRIPPSEFGCLLSPACAPFRALCRDGVCSAEPE